MTNYRYLGYGVTDENGIAKLEYNSEGQKFDHSYTGVGAGEIDVVASLDNPVSEGSIVSETFTVLDTWKKYIDRSLDNWVYNLSNFNFEVKEDYTELSEISGGTTNACARINFNIPLGYCIEFEAKVDGSDNREFARWIQDNIAMTGIKLNYFSSNINVWYKFQLKFNTDGTVTCIANNHTYTAPATSFDPSKEHIQFLFCTPAEITTVQFKNLHIYPF